MDRPLPDGAGVWLEMRDDASFAEATRIVLGSTAPFDSVHLAMAAIAEEIKRCLDVRGDHETALRLLRFVEHAITSSRVPSEFENAVAISFVDVDGLRALDLEALEIAIPTVLSILREQRTRDGA